ncbi:MAG: hypothetical protein Q8R35_01140 [bacterium]|nr:hypothetical protein [bacterium]
MKFFAWFFLFAAAFVFEASILPRLFGGFSPPMMSAVLVLGIAFQGFWPGFAFAGLAGAFADAVSGGGIHAFVALGVFFIMGAFRALTQWEEPLGRIGAVLVGLLSQPILWLLGTVAVDLVFGAAVGRIRAADLVSAYALYHVTWVLLWFVLFSWLAIRGASRKSARRLYRLS